MRFAHLADIHIGAWRDERLRELSIKAFKRSIDICIDKKVSFVIIAGDLFNTPMPSVDNLKMVVEQLKKLKDQNIKVFGIPGSHDFSPSGKTMIDVLESAGLFINVFKYSEIDGQISLVPIKYDGMNITGVIGKKGMLDKSIYHRLSVGFNGGIFIFHNMVHDDAFMDKLDPSLLPEGFDYYAGGHPHMKSIKEIDGRLICYPGPLFPQNFMEIEKLGHGGFYVVDDFKPEFIDVKLKEVKSISIQSDDISEINHELMKNAGDFDGIVTLRIKGTLKSRAGLKIDEFVKKSRAIVMKKIDITEEKVKKEKKDILIDHPRKELVRELMDNLDKTKLEGESNRDFEERLLKGLEKIKYE